MTLLTCPTCNTSWLSARGEVCPSCRLVVVERELAELRAAQSPPTSSDPDSCRHAWKPLSFAFETELRRPDGTLLARQPDVDEGRVYCVCRKCYRHTYFKTKWLGGYIGDEP